MKTWQKGLTYIIINPIDFIGHSKGLSIINKKIFEKIKNWPFTVVKTEDVTITSTRRVTKVSVHTNRGDRLESVDLTTKDLMYFSKCRKPSWAELQHMAYDHRKPETGFKQFAQAEKLIMLKATDRPNANSRAILDHVNKLTDWAPKDKLKAIVTEAANDPDMKAEFRETKIKDHRIEMEKARTQNLKDSCFIEINGTISLSVKTEAERLKAIQFLEGIKINADV